MSIAAFVPARSGSKRLPGKNIKPLGGKPLVLWTLEACTNAQKVDTVVFSTDSEEYWELAKGALGTKKLVLDWRSADEAGDTVKIFDYLKNARDKIFPGDIETFVLALPTAPFRKAVHIDEAITLYQGSNRPVFSAVEYDFSVNFAFYRDGRLDWKPVLKDNPMLTGNTRSQDQKQAFHPNGALYVRRVSDLAAPELATLYENAQPYIMSRALSVDVDTEFDFAIATAMVEKKLV